MIFLNFNDKMYGRFVGIIVNYNRKSFPNIIIAASNCTSGRVQVCVEKIQKIKLFGSFINDNNTLNL